MNRSASVAELTAPRSPRVRSAISNGKLPGGVSACSAEGRRFKDIVHDIAGELGGELSPTEMIEARAMASLALQIEALQAVQLKGERVDSDELVRLTNTFGRRKAALRRNRAARKDKASKSPLKAYLAAKEASL